MGLCPLAGKHRASDLNAAYSQTNHPPAQLPAVREDKNLLAAGDHAPGQLPFTLCEADPIIRPLDTSTA